MKNTINSSITIFPTKMTRHSRLDRKLYYDVIQYRYCNIIMNSYGPYQIWYAGDIHISHSSDRDLYSGGDYIINEQMFIGADGSFI